MKIFKVLALALISVLVMSCQDEEIFNSASAQELSIVGNLPAEVTFDELVEDDHARTTSFTEDMEAGTKTSYAAANVTLASGSWYLSDALIGTSTSDPKNGTKSVRIRNTGALQMNFNMDNGASSVKVKHAKYGTDGSSTWNLLASFDNGSTWYTVGSTITTSSTTLQTVTFTVSHTSAVRYAVSKVSGGTNRINIDDIIVTAGSGSSCTGVATPGVSDKGNHVLFGNPSDATTSSTNNYLHTRSDFVVCYNGSRGIPNYVSWHLSKSWTGTGRASGWTTDPNLPTSLHQATDSDYTGSNFDRGHICPNMDRNENATTSKATLQFSNAAPQNPSMNQTQWVQFETYLNDLVNNSDKEIYIVSGVIGTGGYDKNNVYRTALPNDASVTVPAYFWKVALILPNGTDDVCRTTASNAQMIGVYMQNKALSGSWTSFTQSVDYIESITGYDFFENLEDVVENSLETAVY